MSKLRWLPVLALASFVSCVIAPSPSAVRSPGVRTPHDIVPIVDVIVQADLTSGEILINNPVPDRPLVLKLYRDFVRVTLPEYLYYNRPQRVPLQANDLYLVSVSSETRFDLAVFQLVKGRLHVTRLD